MPKILLEEKPVRRALAEALGLSGETRVEILTKRYKDALTGWSESPMVELAAGPRVPPRCPLNPGGLAPRPQPLRPQAMRRVLKE